MQSPEPESSGNNSIQWDQYRAQLEDYIREQPLQAALAALAAGFLLTKLPIRSLLSVLIGLVLFSVKPALLISGAIKLFEESQRVRNR
jgi:hypothetical protein